MLSRSRLRRGGALGAAAVAVLAILIARKPDLPSRAAHDFLRVRDGGLVVTFRNEDPRRLEAWFARQGLPFPVGVREPAAEGFRLRGGRRHTIAGKPSALVVYRGPAEELRICETFAGRLSELPSPEEAPPGEPAARVYRREGSTQVFRQAESALEVCVESTPPNVDGMSVRRAGG